jgi:hypothetical protein
VNLEFFFLAQEIAELYESEHNIEQAIVYFEKSADFFQNEEVTTSANQCKDGRSECRPMKNIEPKK